MAMTRRRWRLERHRIEEINRRIHTRPLAMDVLLALVLAILFGAWSIYVIMDAAGSPGTLSLLQAALPGTPQTLPSLTIFLFSDSPRGQTLTPEKYAPSRTPARPAPDAALPPCLSSS